MTPFVFFIPLACLPHANWGAFKLFWRFRTKYHPKEAALRQKEYKKSLKRRLSVFLNLLKSGKVDSLSLDIDNSEAIIKLLDAGKFLEWVKIHQDCLVEKDANGLILFCDLYKICNFVHF